MAIYKSVKGVGKNIANLKNVLDYVSNEKEGERIYKTSGINISNDSEKAFKQMMITKRVFQQTEGRQYRHHIQSFKPTEVTPELAHKIAVEFAEKNFKNFDVYIATHIDKKHIHNHIIINSVSRENGLKFNELNKREIEEKKGKMKSNEYILEELKEKNQEICQSYGLEVVRATKNHKSINIYDKKEYKVMTRNKGKDSYKMQLAEDIETIGRTAKSKKDFIDSMDKKGVIVEWKDHKKNITFKFKDETKKSIRLSNLEKTFQKDIFSKNGLEKAFQENNINQDMKLKKEELKKLQEISSIMYKSRAERNKEETYKLKMYLTNGEYQKIINKFYKNEDRIKELEQEKSMVNVLKNSRIKKEIESLELENQKLLEKNEELASFNMNSHKDYPRKQELDYKIANLIEETKTDEDRKREQKRAEERLLQAKIYELEKEKLTAENQKDLSDINMLKCLTLEQHSIHFVRLEKKEFESLPKLEQKILKESVKRQTAFFESNGDFIFLSQKKKEEKSTMSRNYATFYLEQAIKKGAKIPQELGNKIGINAQNIEQGKGLTIKKKNQERGRGFER